MKRHPSPWRQAEPWRVTAHDNVRTVLEIVAGVSVLILVLLGFYVWAWIAAASMVQP
jgi:hypothetical protein